MTDGYTYKWINANQEHANNILSKNILLASVALMLLV